MFSSISQRLLSHSCWELIGWTSDLVMANGVHANGNISQQTLRSSEDIIKSAWYGEYLSHSELKSSWTERKQVSNWRFRQYLHYKPVCVCTVALWGKPLMWPQEAFWLRAPSPLPAWTGSSSAVWMHRRLSHTLLLSLTHAHISITDQQWLLFVPLSVTF